MKKILSFLIALVLVCMPLSSCGKADSDNDETDANEPETTSFEMKDEMSGYDIYSGVIQIGSEVIELPCSLASLDEKFDGIEIDTEDNNYYDSVTEMFSVGTYNLDITVPFCDGKSSVTLNITNMTDKKAGRADMTVIPTVSTQSEGVWFPKGISVGSTYSEMTAVFGETQGYNDEDGMVYSYNKEEINESDNYAFHVSSQTKCVTSISCSIMGTLGEDDLKNALVQMALGDDYNNSVNSTYLEVKFNPYYGYRNNIFIDGCLFSLESEQGIGLNDYYYVDEYSQTEECMYSMMKYEIRVPLESEGPGAYTIEYADVADKKYIGNSADGSLLGVCHYTTNQDSTVYAPLYYVSDKYCIFTVKLYIMGNNRCQSIPLSFILDGSESIPEDVQQKLLRISTEFFTEAYVSANK